METFFLNGCGHPAGLGVLLHQLALDVSHIDEPTIEGTVDKGSLTTPAEGIVMLDCALAEQAAASFQILHNGVVGLFDVDAGVVGYVVGKFTIFINRHDGVAGLDNAGGSANTVIVLTKAWGLMNDTGTSVSGNVGIIQHLEASIFLTLVEVREEGLVLETFELSAFHLLEDFVLLDFALFDDVIKTLLHADVDFLGCLIQELDVVKSWVDTEGQV